MPLMIHNPSLDGSLMVDDLTGVIVTPAADRPAWSAGLVQADLAEHRDFYQSHIGSYEIPALLALEDLEWIGVDETGEGMVQFASTGVRQARVTDLTACKQTP